MPVHPPFRKRAQRQALQALQNFFDGKEIEEGARHGPSALR
jgi:hypothetical protein